MTKTIQIPLFISPFEKGGLKGDLFVAKLALPF